MAYSAHYIRGSDGLSDLYRPDAKDGSESTEGETETPDDGEGGEGGGGSSSETTVDLSARTISVPSIVNDYTDEELNKEYHVKQEYMAAIDKFGAIYKVVSFSDVSSVAKLKEYAKEWIRRNYYDGVLSFDVKAVDLHLLGYDKNKILCGDRIAVEFLESFYADRPPASADEFKKPITVTRNLTCISVQFDILKPENTNYKIGVPDLSANVKYRESVTKKSTDNNTNSVKNEQEAKEAVKNWLTGWGIDIGDPETVPDE